MLGWGGNNRVSEITGLDPKTIRQGRIDLQDNLDGFPSERIRREGGRRPPLEKKYPTIAQDLAQLVRSAAPLARQSARADKRDTNNLTVSFYTQQFSSGHPPSQSRRLSILLRFG